VRSRLRELVEQSQRLLDKQLEVEGRYLEGLAKLQAAEGQLLEAARAYVVRQKLCLRVTTDYWVNAMDGQPFFLLN